MKKWLHSLHVYRQIAAWSHVRKKFFSRIRRSTESLYTLLLHHISSCIFFVLLCSLVSKPALSCYLSHGRCTQRRDTIEPNSIYVRYSFAVLTNRLALSSSEIEHAPFTLSSVECQTRNFRVNKTTDKDIHIIAWKHLLYMQRDKLFLEPSVYVSVSLDTFFLFVQSFEVRVFFVSKIKKNENAIFINWIRFHV